MLNEQKNARKTNSFIEIERGIYIMMVDYGYHFAITLQKKLKNKIKGRIFAGVTDNDVLFVDITNEDGTVLKYHLITFQEDY